MKDKIFNNLLKLIFTLILSASLSARVTNQDKTKGLKKKLHRFESHEQYDFKSCEKYNKDNTKDYYIACDEQELIKQTSFDEFSDDVKKVQYHIYQENIFELIKNFTLEQLEDKKREVESIEKCLRDEKDPGCKLIVDALIENTKKDLTSMRAYLSLKDNPPPKSQYSIKKQEIFNKSISHDLHSILGDELEDIQAHEVENIENIIADEVYNNKQEWMKEQSLEHPQCIKKVSNQFILDKERRDCLYLYSKMNIDSNYTFRTKSRDRFEQKYLDMASKNPIVSHMKIPGSISDDSDITKVLNFEKKFRDEFKKAISKIRDSINYSIKRTKELQGYSRRSLINNSLITEKFIELNGNSEVLCDVMQSLKDDEAASELIADIGLGLGIAGIGIACGMSAGLICGLTAAIGGEALALAIVNNRYEQSSLALSSELTSAKSAKERASDVKTSYFLSPLSVLGIDKGVKLTREASKKISEEIKDSTTHSKPSSRLGKGGSNSPSRHEYRVHRKKAKVLSKTKKVRAPKSKNKLISKYLDYKMVDEDLNQSWINRALANDADLYLDIDNAAMKRLNDTLGNKDYVTALTNYHKDILSRKINKVLRKYPGIEVDLYSDFKTIRYAFKSNSTPANIPDSLIKELSTSFEEANSEFAKTVTSLEGIPIDENPSRWFQGGFGESADQAGNASKKSRTLDSKRENAKLTPYDKEKYAFTRDPKAGYDDAKTFVQMDVDEIKKTGERLRDATHPLHQKGLIESIPNSNESTVAQPIMELLRKSSVTSEQQAKEYIENIRKYSSEANPPDIGDAIDILNARAMKKQIEQTFGVELTQEQSMELIAYANRLDGLTPGLWIAKREQANLSQASFGGMTGDVTGMGARNLTQVAYDLAKEDKLNATRAIELTRQGENEITQTFKKVKEDFQLTVETYLENKGIKFKVPCSGDDCVVIPARELTHSEQQDLVRAFKNKENPSQFRLSFVPKGITSELRTQQAVNGELIEKALRKHLTGVANNKIAKSRLDQITIATRMPNSTHQGNVDLLLGLGNDLKLSESEIELINEALDFAIKKVNSELSTVAKEEGGELTSYNYRANQVDLIE